MQGLPGLAGSGDKAAARKDGRQDLLKIVMTTLPLDKANDLSRDLILKKYAACVNVLPAVQSFYFWEGELCQDREALLLIKTHEKKLALLLEHLKDEHPYAVPELVAFEQLGVNKAYLEWVESYVEQN